MPHITFILPYEDVRDMVEETLRTHSRLFDTTYSLHAAQVGRRWSAADFLESDVVIARGFAARRIADVSPVPSVELQITSYDVVLAVKECIQKHKARTIGIVGTANMLYGVEALGRIFPDARIVGRAPGDESGIKGALLDLKANGCQAVLGGRTVCRAAPGAGLPAVMLKTGRESVSLAIDEALRTVDAARAEKQRANRMAAIMNYTMEGIIATDRDGRITMINQFARSLCCRDGESPVGRPVRDYLPGAGVGRMFRLKEPLLRDVRTVGGDMLVVNFVPLAENDVNTGYVITFQRSLQIQEMEDKIRKSLNPKGFFARYSFADIMGTTPAIGEAKRLAERFARSEASILIGGETGCGKEFFAQSIHNASSRAGGPFVAVNCAALPEPLLESELFGYVEGAFTGAAKGGKAGLFEMAHNGTIFLDEIGDIAPAIQTRLLRVLEEREVIRLGHDRITPVNVRIIAATNKNLYREVAEGRFRSDLLYRLEVLKLQLPPLRERTEDIRLLAECFFREMQQRQHTDPVTLDEEALALMRRQPWPGNIRELRNFCERLTVLVDRPVATRADVLRALGDMEGGAAAEMPEAPVRELRARDEKERIEKLLIQHNGSRKTVAAALGIDTSTLWRKMRRYEL